MAESKALPSPLLNPLPQAGEEANVSLREFQVNASRGKGSHQTLYFGNSFTIIRNLKDELKTGTFHGMCSQLGVKPNDL
jgi:mRNA interferase HicA